MSTAFMLGPAVMTNPGNGFKLTDNECARFVIRFLNNNRAVVADFRERVDFGTGAPRRLTVEGLIVIAIVSALGGDLHIRKIGEAARSLHPSIRHDLGITWTDRRGNRRHITDRQVDYLFTRMATAFPHIPPDPTVVVGDMVVNVETGEMVAPEERPAAEVVAETPSVERVGNRLLAALWDFVGLPPADEWALDSYVAETHYGARSYGGFRDIDPAWVANDDRPRANGTRADALAYHAAWADVEHPARDRQSRRPAPVGPEVPGDFTRVRPGFPQAGPDGRLRHTVDAGAGTAYSGAGRYRSSAFLNGRDKHTIVAAGFLPNGDPYPPLLRTYTAVLGGESRVDAGLLAFAYGNTNGIGAGQRHSGLDRIYTAADEFEKESRRLGWTLTKSLTEHQQTVLPWATGVILVDGFWYSDGLPDRLRELPARPRNVTADVLAALEAKYDKRIPFAYRHHGVDKTTGNLRLRGPAVPKRITRNASGEVVRVTGMSVACPNSPYYHLAPADLPLTACHPDRVCGCSKTITIKVADIPSSYEPTLWGSSRWARRYGRRNLVESFNAVEKHHYKFTKHSIRVRAHKWDLAHLFLTIAVWVQQVRRWLLRQGAYTVDPGDVPGGALNPNVVTAVIGRVTCAETDAIPPDG